MPVYRIVESSAEDQLGSICAIDNEAECLALVDRRNVVNSATRDPASLASEATVVWSGSLGEDLSEPEPRNWMGPGRDALERWLRAVMHRRDRTEGRVFVQPHAYHVVSDIPGCAWFHREFCESGQFGLALSPATIMTTDMLRDLDDHLTRLFEVFGRVAGMVILEDVQSTSDSTLARRVPLGDGRLPRDLLRRLLMEHLPENTPIVISNTAIEQQREWLGR